MCLDDNFGSQNDQRTQERCNGHGNEFSNSSILGFFGQRLTKVYTSKVTLGEVLPRSVPQTPSGTPVDPEVGMT